LFFLFNPKIFAEYIEDMVDYANPYQSNGYKSQIGGSKCSICESEGATKTTCPYNPLAKNKNFGKHVNCKPICSDVKHGAKNPAEIIISEPYDVIIVGAGIAGMWTAYQLQKALPTYRIVVLEAESHAGGRINTFREHKKIFELGPSRIVPSMHPHLFQVLKELDYTNDDLLQSGGELMYALRKAYISGLSQQDESTTKTGKKTGSKLTKTMQHGPITAAAQYTLTAEERVLASNLQPKELLHHVLQQAEKQATPKLTLAKFLHKVVGLSDEMVRYLRDAFGYNSEFDVMNAADAIQELTRWTMPNIEFFMLKSGLDSIIHRIHKRIKSLKHPDIIMFNTPVTHLQMEKSIWNVTSGTTIFQARQLVLALPQQALSQLIKAPFLKFSEPQSLVRLFVFFDRPWFKNLPATTISTGPIRFVFHITDTIMQIYVDGPYAIYWRTLLENSTTTSTTFAGSLTWDLKVSKKAKSKLPTEAAEEVEPIIFTSIHSAMATLFPQYKDEIKPERVLAHACWTHFWVPGANSKQIVEQVTGNLLHHDPSLPPLYVCGEAFSQTQGWMEGAIETANLVISNIISATAYIPTK
jgi:monoamine oxidase